MGKRLNNQSMKHFNKMRMALLPIIVMLVTALPALAQPLNGTYTIYGSSPDYSTLAAAATDLNNKGVSGPVIFKVRQGTWSNSTTAKAQINAVAGASATNTITFEAESGVASNTIINNTRNSSSTSYNYVFYFNNAKYIRVRNLTLRRGTSASYQVMLRFAGSAQNNIVENCVLDGLGTTSSSNARALIYCTSGANVKYNIIRNNTADGGSMLAYWRGSSSSSSSLSDGNEISGNTYNDAGYYGIYSYYNKNFKVKNNIINKTSSGTFYGFYNYYCDNAWEFSGNKLTVNRPTNSSTTYGTRFYYCDGTSTQRGKFENNEININTRGTIYNYFYYSNYYSLSGNKFYCSTLSSTLYPLYNYNYTNSSFTYGKHCYIENNDIYAKTNGTIYLYGHYYYQQSPKFNNNKIVFDGGSGTQYIYGGYYYQYDAEIKNNDIKMTGTSGYKYLYMGYYYNRNNYEFSGNKIDVTTTTGRVYNYALYYPLNLNNFKVNNNDIKIKANTTGTNYLYNYLGYYNYQNTTAAGREINNNTIDIDGGTSSYSYNYMGYYFNGCDVIGNDVLVRGRIAYGLYSYGYSSGSLPWRIMNNKVRVFGGTSTAMGLYFYYCSNAEVVNNSVYASGSSTTYGLYGGYNNNGGVRILNNTVHTKTTGTHYTLRAYETQTSQFATIYNNVISRSGGTNGYLVYNYHPQYEEMDYNNLYSFAGGNLAYYPGGGGNFGSITALRAGTGNNMNSLSYDPGFTNLSAGDITPNPASPNSWSLNGRGIQMSGNDKDINGNARALTTIAGVPDIGAYEFTPTSTPPNCAATPATPSAGTDQVFTFGEDTVAVMHWNANVPSSYTLKQYTGTNPPGILSINPTQMFFYVSTSGSGSNLDYTQDLYYKDPWMGTIASESALRLAERISSTWSGYSPTVSSSNTTRNFINTPGVNAATGLFTGIDVKDNAGSDAIVDPAPPFCPGTYTVKVRIKNNGNNKINKVNISWELNGTIPRYDQP